MNWIWLSSIVSYLLWDESNDKPWQSFNESTKLWHENKTDGMEINEFLIMYEWIYYYSVKLHTIRSLAQCTYGFAWIQSPLMKCIQIDGIKTRAFMLTHAFNFIWLASIQTWYDNNHRDMENLQWKCVEIIENKGKKQPEQLPRYTLTKWLNGCC